MTDFDVIEWAKTSKKYTKFILIGLKVSIWIAVLIILLALITDFPARM